jgi:hypothetical protein
VYFVPLSAALLLTGASCDTQKMQFIGTRDEIKGQEILNASYTINLQSVPLHAGNLIFNAALTSSLPIVLLYGTETSAECHTFPSLRLQPVRNLTALRKRRISAALLGLVRTGY